MDWKWSKGEKYEKSKRLQQINKPIEKNINIEKDAIVQSLLSDTEIDSNWNYNLFMQNSSLKQPNKREETYNKMSEREMICQIGQNPFMNNNNYLEDVISQDNYLKPKNTVNEKE